MYKVILFIICFTYSIFPLDQKEEILEAVRDGNVVGLKKLLKSKIKLDFVNNREMTPLMLASSDNNLEIVKILVEAGADINAKHKETGKTPLMFAASLGYDEVCEYLLNQKDILINAKDKEGKTALMHAVVSGRAEVVKLLIDKKANIHARTNTEESALSLAIKSARPEIIKILKENGARE